MKKITFTMMLLWIFCLLPSVFALSNDLSGEWELMMLNGESIGTSVPITINFISDQKVAEGFSGCNEYNTLYIAVGADIQFGSIATLPPESETASPECESASNTETVYFEALASSAIWSQDGQLLLLQDSSGISQLQYSRIDETVPLAVSLNDVVIESESIIFVALLLFLVGLSAPTLKLIKIEL